MLSLQGSQYWRFENDVLDPNYPKVIETGFDGLRGHITAALSVPQYQTRRESVYFFKRGDEMMLQSQTTSYLFVSLIAVLFFFLHSVKNIEYIKYCVYHTNVLNEYILKLTLLILSGGAVQKYSYQFGTSPSCSSGRRVQNAVYTARKRMVRQAGNPRI